MCSILFLCFNNARWFLIKHRELIAINFYILLLLIRLTDTHLIRKAPSAYSDGVYGMAGPNRPSPRKLSRLFMRGQDGLSSKENRTALLAFFGQVVTNEIVMASESGCPIEMHRIEVERCDEMYDKDCRGDRYIPFHRALYDRNTGQSPNVPREQVSVNLLKYFRNNPFNQQ